MNLSGIGGAAAPVLAVAFALAAGPVAGQTVATETSPGLALPVVEDTLPNGLRVLVLPRPGAPTAAFVLRFGVGSASEGPGETGLAHLLEHLLFKGTTTIGTTSFAREEALFRSMDAVFDTLVALRAGSPDPSAAARLRRRIRTLEERARAFTEPTEFDRIMTEAGSRGLNATTSPDATHFYVQLPANRAELWFVLEADRWANPVFRDFYTERDVVLEERRQQIESSPAGRLAEAFFAAAFREHPYGVPVIGQRADVETHTRARVEAFHRRHYQPGNAVAVVVGDIDPERVLGWARRYLGPIPAGAAPVAAVAEEPVQHGERRVEVVYDAAPDLVMGWRVPAGPDPESPAVAVLAQVLAGGRTSRLYRRLVLEDGVASHVSHALGPGHRHPRMLTVAARPLSSATVADVEAAIEGEVERLVREPPTDLEMRRVRNQMEAGEVYRLGSNFGLAFQLAESVGLYGDWRETFYHAERLAAVTGEDVQRAAARYLRRENRTVAVLVRPEDEHAGATP